MTRAEVAAWLRGRSPKPPPALADRLAQRVVAAPDAVFAGGSMAEVAGRLGLATLRAVVGPPEVAEAAAGDAGRAMDLLAADAFVTYAFEAAAQEAGDVTDLARRLLGESGA